MIRSGCFSVMLAARPSVKSSKCRISLTTLLWAAGPRRSRIRFVTIKVRSSGSSVSMRSNTRTGTPRRASKEAVNSPAADPPTTATLCLPVKGPGEELFFASRISGAILVGSSLPLRILLEQVRRTTYRDRSPSKEENRTSRRSWYLKPPRMKYISYWGASKKDRYFQLAEKVLGSFGWRSYGAPSRKKMAIRLPATSNPASVYAVAGEDPGMKSAAMPNKTAKQYSTRTAPRWPSPRFDKRCAVWSLPGEVKGSRPRRAREIEISVVSKIGTPRIRIGISQVIGKGAPSGRILSPRVAIRNPRNIAPPSPMKIFAGLKFQRRNPSEAPRVAAPKLRTSVCPFMLAEIVKKVAATAAIPAHRPALRERMVHDAVMPTTHNTVKQSSRITPVIPGTN